MQKNAESMQKNLNPTQTPSLRNQNRNQTQSRGPTITHPPTDSNSPHTLNHMLTCHPLTQKKTQATQDHYGLPTSNLRAQQQKSVHQDTLRTRLNHSRNAEHPQGAPRPPRKQRRGTQRLQNIWTYSHRTEEHRTTQKRQYCVKSRRHQEIIW